MKISNNKTVLDLKKVQHGTFFYVNQYGDRRYVKPSVNTVRGMVVMPALPALYHPDYPGESEYHRAIRLNILDKWKPVVVFQLTANHNITYTGDKAIAMWKAWNTHIFGQKKNDNI